MRKNEIVRPVPDLIRAGLTMSPDQNMIAGTLDHVLREVQRGRRAGLFTCDHVSEQDGTAWAVVTMRPPRSRLLPVALVSAAVGLVLVLLTWLLLSAAGAALLVVVGAAAIVLVLRSGSRPSVRVGVNVQVDR